jgi:phosphoribosylaminoimidazolecarboxamide formyltransferase/IMP cyclohydrolase
LRKRCCRSPTRRASSRSRAASRLGIRLLSTGGTAKALADAGLAVTEIGDYTGFPEMLDGRVKTLHPKVHGGILARRDSKRIGRARSARHSDDRPRRRQPLSVSRDGRETSGDARRRIENIDIGGPTLLRAAAKNWQHVGVVVEPADYEALLAELGRNGRVLSAATRFALAQKAFSHTASYDGAISNWLTARGPDNAAQPFPERFNLQAIKVQDLRYGENPHQQRRSIATSGRCRERSRRTVSCRARSCRSTTSPIPMRRGNA